MNVRRAAEELDAVVVGAVDGMCSRSSRAAAREGEAVELVVGAQLGARELDADVAEGAAVVRLVRAAVDAVVVRVDALDVLDEVAVSSSGSRRPLLVARSRGARPPSHQARSPTGFDEVKTMGARRGALRVDGPLARDDDALGCPRWRW